MNPRLGSFFSPGLPDGVRQTAHLPAAGAAGAGCACESSGKGSSRMSSISLAIERDRSSDTPNTGSGRLGSRLRPASLSGLDGAD